MKAIIVETPGGPEVLKVKDVPVPTPNDDEVLVKIFAAGVNPVDTYIRAGYFGATKSNFSLGLDLGGIVEQVGANVTQYKAGDRVFCCMGVRDGAYAQFAAVKASRTFLLPDNHNFEEGAGIGVPYFTAYRGLVTLAKLQPGETVLVHGATGAVGLASVQIAKHLGLTVIGTGGTEEGLKFVKDAGADHVFNHREDGYMDQIKAAASGGVDSILEMLADVNLPKDLQIIKPRGRIVIIGSRGECKLSPGMIMGTEAQIFGLMLFGATEQDWIDMGKFVVEGMRNGKFRPKIAATYPLEDAPQAHKDQIENAGTKGKLVLQISH